jgi:hypothetical protein
MKNVTTSGTTISEPTMLRYVPAGVTVLCADTTYVTLDGPDAVLRPTPSAFLRRCRNATGDEVLVNALEVAHPITDRCIATLKARDLQRGDFIARTFDHPNGLTVRKAWNDSHAMSVFCSEVGNEDGVWLEIHHDEIVTISQHFSDRFNPKD